MHLVHCSSHSLLTLNGWEGLTGPPSWGLSNGPTTRPCKKNIVKKLKTTKPRKSIDSLDNRLGNQTGNAGILRFGTWNIRILYKPGSLQCVLKEISRYNVDIVGLQEIGQDRAISNPKI